MYSFLWDEPLDADLDTGIGQTAAKIVHATRRFQREGDLYKAENPKGPVTIAVYGPWGSGKTSLLKQIEHAFGHPEDENQKPAFTFYFEPWRYEQESNLILPLLTELTAEVAGKVRTKARKEAAVEAGMRLLGRAAKASARTAAGFLADKVGISSDDIEKIGEDFLGYYQENTQKFSYPESENAAFQNDFKTLVHLAAEMDERRTGMPDTSKTPERPICILVDDLDRCAPEQVRRMLESMKNFLWVDGVNFVLALDRAQVTNAISEHRLPALADMYDNPKREAEGWAKKYLEKFFLYAIDIEHEARSEHDWLETRDTFWEELGEALAGQLPNNWSRLQNLFECSDGNMRRLKRAARWLYYECSRQPGFADPAARSRWEADLEARFADLIISECFPEFWVQLIANRPAVEKRTLYVHLQFLAGAVQEPDTAALDALQTAKPDIYATANSDADFNPFVYRGISLVQNTGLDHLMIEAADLFEMRGLDALETLFAAAAGASRARLEA